MQIECASKDFEIKMKNHKERTCPAKISRSAKERLFKEVDRDIIKPMETIKELLMDLMRITKDMRMREELNAKEESWMDANTKGIMCISDNYTNIPETDTGGDDLDVSAVSSQGNPTKASLRVKKADPPRFDGKIPSYPRFKKEKRKSNARL